MYFDFPYLNFLISITFINKTKFIAIGMEKIKVKVYIDRENRNKTLELDNNMKVEDLLKELKLNPVTVIVSRNSELILEDEKLNNNDEIKILSVISGG